MGVNIDKINDPRLRARILAVLAAGAAKSPAPGLAAQAADCKRPSAQSEVGRHQPARRIRQSQKPVMNKLEAAWFEQIRYRYPNYPPVRPQAKRYEIGRGAWFKPDFTCSIWPVPNGAARETAWECKGPSCMKNVARGMLALKAAAHQWSEVRFVLVWRVKGEWHEQEILP
jgi:hypothetical protein